MININLTDDYYEFVKGHNGKKVLYGAGNVAKTNFKLVGDIDCFCDKKATSIKNIDGIECISPEELENLNERFMQ